MDTIIFRLLTGDVKMTKFEVYDEVGRVYNVECVCTLETLRAYMSEFKTHCREESSSYVFAHFINWVRKNKGLSILNDNDTVRYRIDM